MYYKCELLVGGYAFAVTDHIKNWDDMTVSFKRNDYDGVVRSFTDKFEFVKGARQLILNEYRKNYLKASASIVVSTRNNSWTWTERFRCALDFSTLSDDGFTLSINAVDDSVAALIKAKKGTQYEYSVNEVKDGKSLHYDGLEMDNQVVFTIPSNDESETSLDITMNDNGYYSLPIYIESEEIAKKNIVELEDQHEGFYVAADWSYPTFVKNISKENIQFSLKAKFNVYYSNPSEQANDYLYIEYVPQKGKGFWESLPYTIYTHKFSPSGVTRTIEIDLQYTLLPGAGLSMYLFSQYGGMSVRFHHILQKPIMNWKTRINPVLIESIKPSVLLNKLLKSMNGGKEGLTGVIVPSGEKRLDNAMILPAESIRQMPGAKVYSSFTKFCNWMSAVFGYVYDINDKVVTFRPRKDYFGDSVVKEIKDYNGYSMKINSSLIYSQVNVGYEKQDYDSVNGKDEFRFTNIYNTGNTMSDGKLELISPYRADAYGIEFLAQKIGEDTTDNESDTSVFFVCVNEDGNRYVLDRSVPIDGVISPSTMFNAMYSPTSMVEANKDYLGGFVDELLYASSEGNTEVVINGESENRDLTMGGGLFCVDEVEVETSDVELPEEMTGIVRLEHQGEVLEGYYKSSDFSYTKTKSAKITLIMKKLPIKE